MENKQPKAKTTLLSFPAGFLAQVDKQAKVEFRSRSELIRQALREYMERHREQA